MYSACDVLQDAIRCSGGSSRATAAATSAGAHSHVGGMRRISPTRPLPRNFRTFCPCNREWREEFRPWRSTVGGRTPSLRMILVRSARAAGPPPERPFGLPEDRPRLRDCPFGSAALPFRQRDRLVLREGPAVRIRFPPGERCYGAGGEDGNFVAESTDGVSRCPSRTT